MSDMYSVVIGLDILGNGIHQKVKHSENVMDFPLNSTNFTLYYAKTRNSLSICLDAT